MCVFPQSSHEEILTPSAMVFGGRVLGWRCDHMGGALLNRVSALIKRPQRVPPDSMHCVGNAKSAVCNPLQEPHQNATGQAP